MVATLLPAQTFAADNSILEDNKKALAKERTDAYALDYFSVDFDFYQRQLDATGYNGDMFAKVKEITKGITDEY